MTPSRSVVSLGIMGIVTLAAGCSIFDPLPTKESDEPAVLIHYNDTTRIIVADTVVRCTSFAVRLDTFGDYCTQSIVRTDVVVNGSVAEIRPYNHQKVVNKETCSGDIHELRHEPRLTIQTPGTLTLRIFGQQRFPGGGGALSPVQLQKVIVVR